MITVVSGLPRSGTSLMMQILDANGVTILTDHVRCADESNTRGYYEYEKVKSLMKDNSWVGEAEGKAVKIIAQLIPSLPPNYSYDVIFMERDIDEIVSSQEKMLARSNARKSLMSRDILTKTFLQHAENTRRWICSQKNMRMVSVSFKDLITTTSVEIAKINSGLPMTLQTEMSVRVIHPELYREQKNIL